MILKPYIWLFFYFLGSHVAYAQVEVHLPDSISAFGPTPDSLQISRIKGYSLDSLRTNGLKNNPLDSVWTFRPDSLTSKVIDKSRKVIDPILTSSQRYKQALPEKNSLRIPTLDTKMDKDRITGIQKGIYPQIQPELPDLKASVLKLKSNRPELEKLSATENYSQDVIQIGNTADSFSNYNVNSLLSSFSEEAEERATGVLLAEIGEFPSENAGMPDLTSLTESQNSIEDYHANRILEKSKQANHFENRALVDQQRQKLDALKHRYSHVPDSRGLDSLVKKTSLAHFPFFKRLEYGGMLRNPSAKPIQIDLNPFVGYRINKLFVAGGGAWVQLMPGSDSHAKYTGVSFYAMHTVYKRMYVTVGYDISGTAGNPTDTSIKGSKIWAGVGTETALFRTISLRSQISYGFTQLAKANKDEFRSPWSVSFGIVHFK